MNILKQIKEANKAYEKYTGACGKITESILRYLPKDENYDFDFSVFCQAGDGFVIVDSYGNNVRLDAILKYERENRRMTVDEYLNLRI